MKKLLCLSISLLMIVSIALPVFSYYSDVIYSGKQNGDKRIALTFDDGPQRIKTQKVLAILDKYGVKATFFVVGTNAEENPDIIKKQIARGHEIGNHTYDHRSLEKSDCDKIKRELLDNEEILLRIADYHMKVFRPPQGLCSDSVITTAKNLGYEVILWTVDPRDWAKTPTAKMVKNIKDNVRNGCIILFHDCTVPGTHTLEALDIIIPKLKQDGYRFVTVSELLSDI